MLDTFHYVEKVIEDLKFPDRSSKFRPFCKVHIVTRTHRQLFVEAEAILPRVADRLKCRFLEAYDRLGRQRRRGEWHTEHEVKFVLSLLNALLLFIVICTNVGVCFVMWGVRLPFYEHLHP